MLLYREFYFLPTLFPPLFYFLIIINFLFLSIEDDGFFKRGEMLRL